MSWGVVGVTAATAIAGTVMSANAAADQADIAQQQVDVSNRLMREGQPLRSLLLDQLYGFTTGQGNLPLQLQARPEEIAQDYGLAAFLEGGALPTAVAPVARPSVPDMTALNRDVLERQFARARESAIGQAPALGGHLAAALTDLEGQRALGVTDLYTRQNALQYGADVQAAEREDALRKSLFGVGIDIEQDRAKRREALRQALFGQAIGSAWGDVGPAVSSLGQAGQTAGSVASNALARSGQMTDTAAGLAGYLAGGLGSRAAQGDPLAGVSARQQANITRDLQSELINNPSLF